MEKNCFEEIGMLVGKGLKDEALKKLNELCELVENKPNYGGYYWIAKSYYSLNKEKYASKIVENIDSALVFKGTLQKEEFQNPALFLKARAYNNLKQFDLGIIACDEALRKKQDGEGYYIRAVLKNQINSEDESIWEDLKKAENLGNKEATVYLYNKNNKKKI